MKRMIKAAKSACTLHVEYEPYERFDRVPVRRANVSGSNERQALAKMADKMGLYLTADEILDEEKFPEIQNIIDSIQDSNGDGSDYIFLLKNMTTGEVYIDEGVTEDEEW